VTAPRDITVDAGSVELAVLDYGGDGPPAVFLHGGGRTAADAHMVISAMGGAVRAVSVDFRGHGRSGPVTSWGFDDGVADVGAVIAGLGLDHPVVIGHSLGGMVAAAYGARNGGCAGVVNVDGHGAGHASQFDGIDPVEVEAALDRFAEESVAGFKSVQDEGDQAWVDSELAESRAWLEKAGVDWVTVEPLLWRGYRDLGDGRWQRSPNAAVNSSMYLSLRGVEMMAHYRALTCPTLIFRTNDEPSPDPFIARMLDAYHVGLARQLGEVTAANPLVTVEHFASGHMIPLEAPTALAERLLAFVSSL